jgi:hypothetical protein
MRVVYVPNSGTFTADVELEFAKFGHVQIPPLSHHFQDNNRLRLLKICY